MHFIINIIIVLFSFIIVVSGTYVKYLVFIFILWALLYKYSLLFIIINFVPESYLLVDLPTYAKLITKSIQTIETYFYFYFFT